MWDTLNWFTWVGALAPGVVTGRLGPRLTPGRKRQLCGRISRRWFRRCSANSPGGANRDSRNLARSSPSPPITKRVSVGAPRGGDASPKSRVRSPKSAQPRHVDACPSLVTCHAPRFYSRSSSQPPITKRGSAGAHRVEGVAQPPLPMSGSNAAEASHGLRDGARDRAPCTHHPFPPGEKVASVRRRVRGYFASPSRILSLASGLLNCPPPDR
jgi:hypothetical protein